MSPPHVLAVPFYLPGHEMPLLHLCHHLVSSGHCKVSFLQTSWTKNVASFSSPLFTLHTLPHHLLPTGGLRSFQDFIHLHNVFDQLGDTIVNEWKDRKLTCIITDVLVGWGKYVAEALSVPWIALWTSTTTELAVYFNIPRLIPENCVKGTESFVSSVSIPGLPEINVSDYSTLEICQMPDAPMKPILDGFVRKVGLTVHADRVLVNTALALEGNAVESLKASGVNVAPVGPLHLLSDGKGDGADDPTNVLPWLEQQKDSSVLYIAFGTTMPVPAGQIHELASALKHASHVPFVWVMRQSEYLQEVESDLSTVARFSMQDQDKKSLAEDERESCRGFVTDWVPQTKVLTHRAVKAFFTHCGWNSVLESVTSGLPMITRPFVVDQVLTSKLLEEQWGISVRIRRATGREVAVDRKEIEDAINELQASGATLKTRAGELGAVVKEAMQIAGSSFVNLDCFVKDLHSWSSTSCKTA